MDSESSDIEAELDLQLQIEREVSEVEHEDRTKATPDDPFCGVSPPHRPQFSDDSREEKSCHFPAVFSGPQDRTESCDDCATEHQSTRALGNAPSVSRNSDSIPQVATSEHDKRVYETTHVQGSVTKPAPPKRPRIRNLRTAQCVSSKASTSRRGPDTTAPPLERLPPDVLQSILRHVSAEDLSRCACTCQALKRAASEETLWRRLYCSRWSTFQGGERKVLHAHFWKQTYMERDAAEYRKAVLPLVDTRLAAEYHCMHLTERAATVRLGEEPSWTLLTASAQEQLAAYMRARGFPGNAGQPTDTSTVAFVRFGDVFVDENSGWQHVCDSSCSAQHAHPSGAFMVCPHTGRHHGRVPDAFEGDACAAPDVGGEAVAVGDADAPTGLGWLARVYEAGYRHNDDDDEEENRHDGSSLVTVQLT